ncbi:MAG: hypothetical protein ACMUIA_05120 [bacterium]
MTNNHNLHSFQIPVMGIGHSVDTPLRVAPFGISSAISLVDDLLLEKIRRYYSEKYGLPYLNIPRSEEDGRARRITAYLEAVKEIVRLKTEAIKNLPFFESNDKSKYFEMLPGQSLIKRDYQRLLAMKEGPERDELARRMTMEIRPGSIDVNIMVKLDRVNFNGHDTPLSDEFTDAKAALRGYAQSSLRSCIIFSAGINQKLFNYMTRFRDFYRDSMGEIKKKIVLKVSDFRSALIQGKFLAKKGLEVHEFRIESGLNCGGHTFPTDGHLLPPILQEFKEKREQLASELQALVQRYYRDNNWEYPEAVVQSRPILSVQGGIGTCGERHRLTDDFGMDLTGWGSPFLLVPEATCVDEPTRELLRQAEKSDLYLSDVSPLGVPFHNLRKTGSERWTRQRIEQGIPGTSCPKGFLVSNTEFTRQPICLAAAQYQRRKLKEIDGRTDILEREKKNLRAQVVEKTCICHHLGNGALIALGLVDEQHAPQAICPGPNIIWFKGSYTLKEMVDHIYGRGSALVPSDRPHMFAQEVVLYVNYFEGLVARCTCSAKEIKALQEYKRNLETGMDLCLAIARKPPYEGENLASIPPVVEQQRTRLRSLFEDFEKKATAGEHNVSMR